MSIILINATNLKAGGGLQVADSICGQLLRFPQHTFLVVLSSFLDSTRERIEKYQNVKVISYNIPNTYRSIVLGRDAVLDQLVEDNHVCAVFTVFGPSRWIPTVPHLCGFAFAQIVNPESPFFQRMRFFDRLKWKWWGKIRLWSLKRSASIFWTENPFISNRLIKLLPNRKVYTISNYYNQVFDTPTEWKRSITLPDFDGITCLSVSSPTSHKNFGIIEEVVKYLQATYPSFSIRFVLTCSPDQLPFSEDIRKHIVYVGKTEVSQCPYLYEQSDIMFMPTLLECFTATYPEAMRMDVPIVTTDLDFAHSLCGDAACYFSALDARAAAEAIYKVANDKVFAAELVSNGKRRLELFDNYEQRAEKLIEILEEMISVH